MRNNKRTLRTFTGDKPTKHDWEEDWFHENGQYMRKCFTCGVEFIGHKRRSICRECYEQARFTGDKVKALRCELGISQVALADLLQVTVGTVSRWERDQITVGGQHTAILRALQESLKKDLSIGSKLIALYNEHGFERAIHHCVKVAYGEKVARTVFGLE